MLAFRRHSHNRWWGREGGLCNAWLLRSRQGPDGARAHTGYAYGHMPVRSNPRALDERAGPWSTAAVRRPSRSPEGSRDRLDCSQPYAHGESAHEVTRPSSSNPQHSTNDATQRNVTQHSEHTPSTLHTRTDTQAHGTPRSERHGRGQRRVRRGLVRFMKVLLNGRLRRLFVHPTWVSIIRARYPRPLPLRHAHTHARAHSRSNNKTKSCSAPRWRAVPELTAPTAKAALFTQTLSRRDEEVKGVRTNVRLGRQCSILIGEPGRRPARASKSVMSQSS